MTNTESTSTLTDVLDSLAAVGIYNFGSVSIRLERSVEEIKHMISVFSPEFQENLIGYVFITTKDFIKWDDTRYLTIHFGAVDSADLYDVEMALWAATKRAGFQAVDAPKSSNSITLHVPKSRF